MFCSPTPCRRQWYYVLNDYVTNADLNTQLDAVATPTHTRLLMLFCDSFQQATVTRNFLAEGLSLSRWTRTDSFPVGDVGAFSFPGTSSAQRVRPPYPSPRPHAHQPALPAMLTTQPLLRSHRRFFCGLFYGAVNSYTTQGQILLAFA
jgi:hypothetical protein